MNKKELLLSFLNNTQADSDWRNYGILKFAKHFFPEYFYNEFAEHHGQFARLFFSLYDPNRTSRMERQAYFIIHREAAKTTFGTFLIPQYVIWLRGFDMYFRIGQTIHKHKIGEPLILIASETSNMSKGFVTNIREEIETNRELISFFGPKDPRVLTVDDEDAIGDAKWTKDAFRTSDGTTVVGKGAGQQVRGINIHGSRPTLILADDIYSENNTKTAERRETINRWLMAALTNSGDSKRCKVLVSGTVVSEDTAVNDMRTNDQWYGIEKPVISYKELKQALEDLTSYDLNGNVVIAPKREVLEYGKKLKTLSWPERHDLFTILSIYKREWDEGRVRYFYQEYLNMTVPPEEKKFEKSKLRPVRFQYLKHEGLVTFHYDNVDWTAYCEGTIAVDIASSENRASDDTVITAVAYLRAVGRKQGEHSTTEKVFPCILHIEGGRGYNLYADNVEGKERRGIVNSIKKLIRTKVIKKIAFEVNGQQGILAREAKKSIQADFPGIPFMEVISEGKKADRIVGTLEPVWQRYDEILYEEDQRSNIFKMFGQLENIVAGQQGKDDWPDSAATAFANARLVRIKPAIGFNEHAGNDWAVLNSGRQRSEDDWISR